MKNSIALVLAGGGGKGAYQIGAWKGLIEFGVDKQIMAVAGTSVGALNGVLFLQGDYETALKVWESVDSDKILHMDKSRHLQTIKAFKLGRLFTDGVFSSQGLLDLIETYGDLERVSQSKIAMFASCCKIPGFTWDFKLPELEATYFKVNGLSPQEITQVLLASSAIPLVFDSVLIKGSRYVDGGLVDNMPIQPLYDLGYRKFIVVNLDMYQRLPREKYRDADIIEIMPDHTRTENITGILDFDPEAIHAQIQQGYQDTLMTLSSRFKLPKELSLSERIKAFISGASGRQGTLN